jgi:hypothetical protein
MMRALPVALLVCVAGCALQPPVAIEYSSDTDFTQYKTYSWLNEKPPRSVNGPLYEQLRASLERSLSAHGYHSADSAQFSVEVRLLAQERIQVAGSGAFGGDYISSDWDEPVLWSSVAGPGHEQHVHQAVLVVIVFDRRNGQRIWRGVVRTPIKVADFGEPVIDRLTKAVVAQFPPDIRCTETAGRYEPCNIQ